MTSVSLDSRAPVDKVKLALCALVVDDNIASAQTTCWMLESIGHIAIMAHTGKEAIELAKTYKPHIILLDIGMPGMSGYDVCRELRKDPLFKNVAIIAQTGWVQEKDCRFALEAGFDHHLVKPVKYDQFVALIASIQDTLVTHY